MFCKLAQLPLAHSLMGRRDKLVAALTFPGTRLGGDFRWFGDGIFKTENGAQVIAMGNRVRITAFRLTASAPPALSGAVQTIVTPSEDPVE